MKQNKKEKELPTTKPYPEWYRFGKKKEYKKTRTEILMNEYDKFFKENKDFAPNENDRKQYLTELSKLKPKQLFQIGMFQEVKPIYSFIDKWHKLDFKNSIIIRMYHKNNSSTDFVVAKHTRVLSIGNFSYIFPPNAGIFDNKHKKIVYAYYENNPFPIQFGDDFQTTDGKGGTFPDAELLKKTLKFEYAQKLASNEMTKKMDLTFIFSIITMILSSITLILCVKGFKLI